jgi:chromosome segregation ATPase
MAITKEQVFQAADELNAAGHDPSVAKVRKVLNHGSYTTINTMMKEWRKLRSPEENSPREPAPQAVIDKSHALSHEVWAVALELANARLASEREALETARADMEGAQREAIEMADQLSDELEHAKKQLKAMHDQLEKAKTEKDALTKQVAKQTEKANMAEIRAHAIEQRANDLRKALDQAHSERNQALDEAKEAATLRGQIEGLERALSDHQKTAKSKQR